MLERFDIETPFPVLADFVDQELRKPEVAEWVRRCKSKKWSGRWVIGIHWGDENQWGAMVEYDTCQWLMAPSEKEIFALARSVIEKYLQNYL